MKTTILLSLAFLCIIQFSFSQSSLELEGKNLKAKLFNDGDLFWKGSTSGIGFEAPKNSGKSTIFAGQIWVGGVDSASSLLYVSSQTYRQNNAAWYGGPISNSYTGDYDQIYYVERSEVDNHLNNFLNMNYQVPMNFSDWPVSGNVANGEPLELAPYSDFNGNGIYDPENGDHPRIKGNSSAYFVFNDLRDTFPNAVNCCMGLDVEAYVFDLSYQAPYLENSLFFNYEITNRSSRTYENVYIGLWMDPDIGNSADDFMGSDSSENMFFAYNADNFDEGLSGYQNNPPAQGFLFLNQQMSTFMTYNNNSNPVNGNPTSASDFYNYMRGFWRDGTQLTYGGTGIDQSNPPTNYMYSGNGWTEDSVGNQASDRRGVGSIGPFTLRPGESIPFDFVLLFQWDSTVSNLNNRDSLSADIVNIRSYYNSNIASLQNKASKEELISVYPNPFEHSINLDLKAVKSDLIRIELFDQMGRLQLSKDISLEEDVLDLSELPSGMYILKMEAKNASSINRIIKK